MDSRFLRNDKMGMDSHFRGNDRMGIDSRFHGNDNKRDRNNKEDK